MWAIPAQASVIYGLKIKQENDHEPYTDLHGMRQAVTGYKIRSIEQGG